MWAGCCLVNQDTILNLFPSTHTVKHHLEDENAYRTKIYFLGYIQGLGLEFFFREKEKNATLNTGTLTDQDKIRNARGF